MQRRLSNLASRPASTSCRRSGSTLLLVVALMGMMAFLGFVIYTFAAQERANAISAAEDAKVRTAPSVEPDESPPFRDRREIAVDGARR